MNPASLKSLMQLCSEVLVEYGTLCCVCTTRDWETITARVEHEGFSFLTITLPSFAKDFDRSLADGFVAHDSFFGFKRRGAGGLPCFLKGFLELVFDATSGRLLDNPSLESIRAIRQLTLMFGKVEAECTDARVGAAFAAFVETDRNLRNLVPSTFSFQEFTDVAGLLWSDVFSDVENIIYQDGVVPGHGPGTTAEHILGNEKYVIREWPARLEEMFSAADYLIPNARYHSSLERVELLPPGAERPVRVVQVPKTLKTPRIIAIEPAAMQYVQQGIAKILVQKLESNQLTSSGGKPPLTSGMIGFEHQEPNQQLALVGSRDGTLATLDLSEASDRVSNLLVEALLARFPWFSRAVQATRSTRAEVPGHGVIPLTKFASMGSALCFPIEAMVFLTIIFVGIQKVQGRPLTPHDVNRLRGKVRVYGDDMVVPVEYTRSVVQTLEAFGLKVNDRKSFWNGKFRESCGAEFFNGEDVTVVRVRREFPRRLTDVPEIESLISLRNQMYFSGLWRVAAWLDRRIVALLKGHFPTVLPSSPVLGRHSVLGYETQRMCNNLHRPLVRGYVRRNRTPDSYVENEFALLKCLLKRGDEPFADSKHLERQGRPEAVGIKLRWSSAT